MEKKTESHNKFSTEVQSLEEFYVGVLFACDQALERSKDKIDAGHIGENEIFRRPLHKEYKQDEVASGILDLRRKLKIEHPSRIREMVLVNLVSLLEVYLTDIVREVLLLRKDLLQKEEIGINMPSNQILIFDNISDLHSHLVNQKCRHLQNAGFLKIDSFFKKSLEIKFNEFSRLKLLKEMHDKRHLLIHGLGEIDQKYRKDYKTGEHKIHISKKQLLDYFEATKTFASYVNSKVLVLINGGVNERRIPLSVAYIKVYASTSQARDMLSVGYEYLCEKRKILTKDIFFSRARQGDYYDIGVSGKTEEVDLYIKELQAAEMKGLLSVLDVRFVWRITTKTRKFPDDYIKEIDKIIPYGELPESFHVRLGKKLGIKKSQAYLLIRCVKAIRVSGELLDTIENHIPEDLPAGFHEVIAQRFDISPQQAYFAIEKILQRQKY
jgi:hypothetical protein